MCAWVYKGGGGTNAAECLGVAVTSGHVQLSRLFGRKLQDQNEVAKIRLGRVTEAQLTRACMLLILSKSGSQSSHGWTQERCLARRRRPKTGTIMIKLGDRQIIDHGN